MKSYRDLLNAIVPLAEQASELHQQAKALGLFANDRELLDCTGCDLAEDVDAAGRLITWHRGDQEIGVDCGLRFEELAADRFRCPVCGTEMRVEML
jgi:hypothetical protein